VIPASALAGVPAFELVFSSSANIAAHHDSSKGWEPSCNPSENDLFTINLYLID
jgi:hypothetical protein